MELDWNKHFIELLEEKGYAAPSEEEIIDLWLTDLCRTIALEELDGTGQFNEESDEAMRIKRTRLKNGKIEAK